MEIRHQITRAAFMRLSAVLFMLALTASSGPAQTEPRYEGLPNFHQVNEHLYRGAQPDMRAGAIGRLAALGVKSILNLREQDESTRAEAAEAAAAGLKFYSVPMQGMGRPTDEQIERALALISSQENWPIFVHCKRGADRTGTVIALYRISHDNWTAHDAIAEAKRYGLSRFELGMKHYIEDYEKRRK